MTAPSTGTIHLAHISFKICRVRYFQTKQGHGLFVPVEKVQPIVDAQAVISAGLVGLVNGLETPQVASNQVSHQNNHQNESWNETRPVKSEETPKIFRETETTSRLVNQITRDQRNVGDMSGIELVPRTPSKPPTAPTMAGLMQTPVKNILPDSLATPMATVSNNNSMSRELARRQDEVNLIRRQVEPLLLSAQRINGERPPEQLLAYVRSLVAKLSSAMGEYDKVVARYERYLQKIIQHMEGKRQETGRAEHELALKQAELENVNKRLTSAENQAKLLRTEYEQAQRTLAQRVQIGEELEAELAQLRLQASTSSDEAMDALKAALSASREENLVLRREISLLTASSDSKANDKAVEGRLAEILKAKDAQEAYFQQMIETMKQDHQKELGELRAQLESSRADNQVTRADLEATRVQLTEQEARAQRYHTALDQTADRAFDEAEGLRSKLTETVHAMERLVQEKEAAHKELAQAQSKLAELSSTMARTSNDRTSHELGEVVREREKQIQALEQQLLQLTAESGGGEVQKLQRRLAQVEFEKEQIERAAAAVRKSNNSSTNNSSTNSSDTNSERRARAEQIKEELRHLRPALPTLADRLTTLLSLSKPAAKGLEELSESVRQVDAYRRRALNGLAKEAEAMDRTPTMCRQGAPPAGLEPRKLFP